MSTVHQRLRGYSKGFRGAVNRKGLTAVRPGRILKVEGIARLEGPMRFYGDSVEVEKPRSHRRRWLLGGLLAALVLAPVVGIVLVKWTPDF